MDLSVVAPCMNEEEGLEAFYLRLLNVIKISGLNEYEIILIDDGSSDKTWHLIQTLHGFNPNVFGIRLSRNFGHQAALTAGLKRATGEYIFIIDSDLQDPPELLVPMIEKMKTGYDVVYGQRKVRRGETFFKLITAKLFYRFLSFMSDIQIPKDTGDFRLMNRKVLEAYRALCESQRFTRGLIAWLGFRQTALLYERHARYAGTTKYPLKKMINFSLDAMTGFSLKPLRLIVYLGVMVTFLAFIAALSSPSLITALFVLSAVQLISIGIVGEYVGRTFVESRRRPLFLVQETTSQSDFSVTEVVGLTNDHHSEVIQ